MAAQLVSPHQRRQESGEGTPSGRTAAHAGRQRAAGCTPVRAVDRAWCSVASTRTASTAWRRSHPWVDTSARRCWQCGQLSTRCTRVMLPCLDLGHCTILKTVLQRAFQQAPIHEQLRLSMTFTAFWDLFRTLSERRAVILASCPGIQIRLC